MKYFIETFGCQMNGHDSEKIAGMLAALGYERAANAESADVIVLNTCCVRENAENRFYGNLGRMKHLKETNKNARVAVCGCMAQRPDVVNEILTSHPHVDVIFGTLNLRDFPRLLYENMKTGATAVEIKNERPEITEPDAAGAVRNSRYKASIDVIYGCDNFCSYCIVPYVRGREKSRPPREIIREAGELVADGVMEIMLLGQNVNSYGKDLAEKTSFAELLRALSGIDGLRRIRFMTSNPKDLTDDLIDAVADCENVCKHIHLPLQSGSTAVLKAMNRRYTKEGYVGLAEKIMAKIPGVSLTTDIIVGFPGETEDDFSDTLDVVSRVRFANAFTFVYSKRPGTPAAAMENEVGGDVIRERFKRLIALLNGEIYNRNAKRAGETLRVLAEEENKVAGLITGRADDNTLVHFKGDGSTVGKIVDVKITEAKTFYLMGEHG